MPQVRLVADEHDDDVGVCVVTELPQPPLNILVGQMFSDIVDKKGTNCPAVVSESRRLRQSTLPIVSIVSWYSIYSVCHVPCGTWHELFRKKNSRNIVLSDNNIKNLTSPVFVFLLASTYQHRFNNNNVVLIAKYLRWRDGPVPLLTSSVPNLSFNRFSIDLWMQLEYNIFLTCAVCEKLWPIDRSTCAAYEPVCFLLQTRRQWWTWTRGWTRFE